MMDLYTWIQLIIPDRRDNLDSLEHKLKLERDGILPREYSLFYRIIGTIWIHQNISEHDGILHENTIHSTESSGQSGFIRTYVNMMEFYTRIQFILPNYRDNLDSSEHK